MVFTWVLPYLPHFPVAAGEALGRVPMPKQMGRCHWICHIALEAALGAYLSPSNPQGS